MPAIENRQAGIWWAKQTAKGTPVVTAYRKGRHVAGDLNTNRDDGSENYTDGERFNNSADFVNSIIGNGNPTFQAQAGVVGHLAYLMLGQETVTGAGDPYQHVATPANSGSFWTGFWKRVGQSVGPVRQKFNDCRLTSLRIEASSANKVCKVTPTFISLDSGEVFATDPVATEESGEPLLYTEGEGTFRIDRGDGTLAVFNGHSSFAVVIEDAVTPWYGDSVVPHDIVFGVGSIRIEGITILLDAEGLEYYNYITYGSTAPAPGAKPLKTIPAMGAYDFNLTRGNGTDPGSKQIKVELPNVKWTPDMAIPPAPDGGATELALTAQARKVGADPMIRITTKSTDPAYT